MKRLRDTEPDSALVARARQLVESVEPLADDPARLQRVRRALAEAERGATGANTARGGRRWPVWGLAAALGLSGASAFAAVRFVEEWRAEHANEPAFDGATTPAAKAVKRAARHDATEAHADTEADTDWLEPMQPSSDEPRAHATDKARRTPAPRPERDTASPESAADSPHSALVHEALQALRHQHQPARAERLLAEYLTLAPTGPLAEEALSLRIEAAQALGEPRARTLATRYLQRYPSGRYAHVARRALDTAVTAPAP